MKLTSLNRVKRVLGSSASDNDADLLGLIATASAQISQHLRRLNSLQLASRTEYFDPHLGQKVFRPKAFPISSVTSIYVDATGKYAGSETLVPSTDYILSGDSRAVHFVASGAYNDPLLVPPWTTVAPKSVRIIYTGGLAADAVSSTWSKSASTFTVGRYILGTTSRAVGRITATSSLSITYECIYGVFEAGETITEYASFNYSLQGGGVETIGAPAVTATLGAASAVSLAESNPDLVWACEAHVRHLFRNRDNFENIIVSRDGESRASRSDLKNVYGFLPEIMAVLDTYKDKRI